MNRKCSASIIALSLFIGLFSMPANSVALDLSESLYVGFGSGQTGWDSGIDNLTGTTTLDEKDYGYKVFAGMKIFDFLSLEAYYMDFGETNLSANAGDTFRDSKGVLWTAIANDVKLSLSGDSIGCGMYLLLPLGEIFRTKKMNFLAPYIKGGGHFWEGQMRSSATGFSQSEKNDEGLDYYYGGGLQFNFPYNFAIRGEWERYELDGDIGADQIDFVSLNIVFPL